MRRSLAHVALLGLLAASTLPAQAPDAATPRANTEKLFLGLALNGSSIKADELSSSTESGGGLSIQAGWGVTRNFAFFLEGAAARIDGDDGDYYLAHFDIGGRWHFVNPTRALVPFLEIGFTGRAAGEDDVTLTDDAGNDIRGDLAITGSGFSFGGGLQYFVSPTVALGGSIKWTLGEFSTVEFNDISVDGLDIDATTARLNLGVTWYPMAGSRRR